MSPPRPMAAGGRLTLNRLTLFAASRRRAAAPTPFPAFLSLHASCSSSGFPLCIAFESQKIGTISTSYFYLVGDPCSALPPPCRSVGPALSAHTHPRSRSVGRSSTGPHSTVTYPYVVLYTYAPSREHRCGRSCVSVRTKSQGARRVSECKPCKST